MKPDLYLRVREKEGRLYSDDIVRNLPSIPASHPTAGEWKARSASASRLSRYLARFPGQRRILDLGCGNGWLANLLSASGRSVVGLDQNRYELMQAARVFSSSTDLLFVESDIFSAPFEKEVFDFVIIASSLQYFSQVAVLLETLGHYLKPEAEIHIIDSPLYRDDQVESAIKRSREYYAGLGFPEMADFYFHHALSTLAHFRPVVHYQPEPAIQRLKRLLRQADSPFPWISISKQNIAHANHISST